MADRDLVIDRRDLAAVERELSSLCALAHRELGLRLAEAVSYAALGGGKRIRAAIVCEAYRCAGGRSDPSGLAAAVELLHTYSLVHDDLPCMDDDDTRRGRPTLHRAFDHDTALIAGVAMIPLAFLKLAHAGETLGLDSCTIGRLARELASAAGGGGMVGGQWLDLASEGRELSADALREIHAAKTGRLFEAAAAIGGLAAEAPDAVVAALREFGASLGLAYQIADDILDATGESQRLGKAAGRDAAHRKCTFPSVVGLPESLETVRNLAERAIQAVARADCISPGLERLVRYVIQRAVRDG